VSCAETAKPVNLQFGLWTQVGGRKHQFNHFHQVTPMCTISVIFARWTVAYLSTYRTTTQLFAPQQTCT